MRKSIVVIMAHSDDIELSAGATLAKYVDQGYAAVYGVLSRCNSGWTVTAEKGGHYIPSEDIVPRRRAEAEAAAATFGADLYYGDLLENNYTLRNGDRIVPSFTGPQNLEGMEIPPAEIPASELPHGTLFAAAAGAGSTWEGHPVVAEVADLLAKWEPELVIGQPYGNINPDHFLAAQILAIAWQLAARQSEIGPYWLPVMTEKEDSYLFPPQRPDRFVDIGGYEDICRKAMACHVSQGMHLPASQRRRTLSWAQWKEESGFESAEAFIEIYSRKERHTEGT